MTNAAALPGLAQDLLRAAAAAYTEVENAPPVPALQFVTHGDPVWYGSQLTVSIGVVRPAGPFPAASAGPARSSVIPSAEFWLEVVRDGWPQARASAAGAQRPDPAKLTAAAELLAADAAAIFFHVSALAVRGALFPSQPTILKGDAAVGEMISRPPNGGRAGWRWPVRVKLTLP